MAISTLKSTVNKSSVKLATLLVTSTAFLISGCATTELLESDRRVHTRTQKTTLVEDQVIAFGKPASKLANMPSNSVVIVGEENSYVLSYGGVELVNLLTSLDPKSIQVDKELAFHSPNNDGYFTGNMELSYAKLKDEFKRSDLQFFLQNGGKECTTKSDDRIGAQRFCFTLPIKGGVYPQVSNLSMIQSQYKPLTKPYSVSIYTTTKTQEITHRSGTNAAQKLVLLPFALAFDVVTLPLQILAQ